MQLQDLADMQLVSARSVGMKTDEEVAKLTFRNGKKEEEIVLFEPLLCHALDLPDAGLASVLTKNKEQLLDSARTNPKLGLILQKFWTV